jgi:hypothetical protein
MLEFSQRFFLNSRTSPFPFFPMRHRFASSIDTQILGELNHQLIRDEGHRNRKAKTKTE